MSDHDNIAAALVSALTDLTNVAKKNKADTGKYGYSFANIADLIAETRPVLAEHGLVALTPVHEHPDGLACTVTILHRSGERLDFGPTPFPTGKDAQSTGSWITYMRRYCLLAALGMGAEDDDGASAKPAERKQQRAPEQPQKPAGSVSVNEAKGVILEHLTAKAGERLGDDIKAHAREVWNQAEVPVTDEKWVARAELEVLRSVADGYLDDLAAMEPKQETLTDA